MRVEAHELDPKVSLDLPPYFVDRYAFSRVAPKEIATNRPLDAPVPQPAQARRSIASKLVPSVV